MGYTIYLKTEKRITKKEAEKIVVMIRELVDENKDIVEFEPECKFDKFNVAFNGLGEESHETFSFFTDFAEDTKVRIVNALDEQPSDSTEFINGNLEFNFCKTARKPYDKLVKKALMKMQEITKNKLDVSCDDGLHYFSDRIEKKNVAMEDPDGNCQLDQNGQQMYEDKKWKTLEETNEDGSYDW